MQSTRDIKEQQRRELALKKKYSQRITIARQGRDAFAAQDFLSASSKYTEYLSILAELNNAQDIYRLNTNMFDPKSEITEMLLISHVYWEIARINELSPELHATFLKALSQFVKFTTNQPYQVLNAEMLRKYIKKTNRRTSKTTELTQAYNQIFTQSKKCYIATLCYGSDHSLTNDLRSYKKWLLKSALGFKLVEYYYLYSSSLVSHLSKHKQQRRFIVMLSKPFLYCLAKTSRLSIFK